MPRIAVIVGDTVTFNGTPKDGVGEIIAVDNANEIAYIRWTFGDTVNITPLDYWFTQLYSCPESGYTWRIGSPS